MEEILQSIPVISDCSFKIDVNQSVGFIVIANYKAIEMLCNTDKSICTELFMTKPYYSKANFGLNITSKLNLKMFIMSLEEYKKKRNFENSSEPKGKEKNNERKLKFVVQRHAASRLHYDFRLEINGVLKSWAVPKGPSMNPSDKRLAVMVEDHPYDYAKFEGTISPGNYGAGEVEIWDQGFYIPVVRISNQNDDSTIQSELNNGKLEFVLKGKKLKGEFILVRMKNSKDENAWLLIKNKDNYAVSASYDAEQYTSKKSKVTAYLNHKKKE